MHEASPYVISKRYANTRLEYDLHSSRFSCKKGDVHFHTDIKDRVS